MLGVASCGILTLDPVTRELTLVGQPRPARGPGATRCAIPEGEGIAGRAVRERRPVQSADLWSNDPRVRHRELPRPGGLRSMLAVPLRVGDRAIGAIEVFRRDVHQFSAAEEELLVALADQAAIALEHARLYTASWRRWSPSARASSTRRSASWRWCWRRCPLGVFVLDADLAVVRANRDGAPHAGLRRGTPGRAVPPCCPADKAGGGRGLPARGLRRRRRCARSRRRWWWPASASMLPAHRRAARRRGDDGAHAVSCWSRTSRWPSGSSARCCSTERLTTAGRLAAGVAHELNNPLATIAGCAESLLARYARRPSPAATELADFRDLPRA